MKKVGMASTASVVSTFIGLTLILMEPASVSAQQPNAGAPPQPPAPPACQQTSPASSSSDPRTSTQSLLDQQLLSMKRSSAEALRNRERLAQQLTQDFERLDLLNKQSIEPLAVAASLDYKSLLDLTVEIKGRATRIKYNIPLPLKNKKREEIRYGVNAEQIGSMLSELGRLLKSFTGNPVFHLNSPDDSELRSMAGRDLESIIRLSETINKIANRLNKSAVPVQ